MMVINILLESIIDGTGYNIKTTPYEVKLEQNSLEKLL